MARYALLWKFTEKGLAHVQDSPKRAEAFTSSVRKLGAKIDTFLWLAGPYDGLVILEAPDDETAAAVAVSVGKLGNITPCTLRAYDAAEFRKIVDKIA
jgi:uncharacterized protein with GYD domain